MRLPTRNLGERLLDGGIVRLDQPPRFVDGRLGIIFLDPAAEDVYDLDPKLGGVAAMIEQRRRRRVSFGPRRD
jgi:hypothetical protein